MSYIHFMLCITLRTMLFVKKSRELNLFLIKLGVLINISTTIKFKLIILS